MLLSLCGFVSCNNAWVEGIFGCLSADMNGEPYFRHIHNAADVPENMKWRETGRAVIQ